METIGVLAVQGNFREHAAMLRRLGARVVEVRKPEQLERLDGLVIPGGESTAIMRLIRLYGLEEAIERFAAPIFGTCAGMILLDRNHLGLVDLTVERNGYGRQVASFEADLRLEGDEEPLRGVFIRAPRVVDEGPEVQTLAELRGRAGSAARPEIPRRVVPSRADGRHPRPPTIPRHGPGRARLRGASMRAGVSGRSRALPGGSPSRRNTSLMKSAAQGPTTGGGPGGTWVPPKEGGGSRGNHGFPRVYVRA